MRNRYFDLIHLFCQQYSAIFSFGAKLFCSSNKNSVFLKINNVVEGSDAKGNLINSSR